MTWDLLDLLKCHRGDTILMSLSQLNSVHNPLMLLNPVRFQIRVGPNRAQIDTPRSNLIYPTR